MNRFLLAAMFSLSVIISHGQDDPTDNDSKFTFSGYLDAFYSYNLNKPTDLRNDFRVFDNRHNTIQVGLIQTQLTYTTGDLEIVGDITFGPNANVANYGNVIAGSAIVIKQAYLAYHFNDKLKLTVGQYGTHMGFEPIESYLNFNYSLSYQFAYGPIYHTGIKLDYQLNENWSVMAGVVNGWDELIDVNESKSITLQVATTAIPNAELALNWIGGDENGSPASWGNFEGSYTSLVDIAGRYHISDNFMLGTNAGFGWYNTTAQFFNGADPYSGNGTWWAAAFYIQYYLNDEVGIGFRGERIDDPNSFRTGVGSLNGLTFTVDYKLSENFMIKPEIRIDQSDNAVFTSSDGANTTQPTIGIAFIGKIR